MVSKFQLYILTFRRKARVWRTVGQNYDPQDRGSIAASHGKYRARVFSGMLNSSVSLQLRALNGEQWRKSDPVYNGRNVVSITMDPLLFPRGIAWETPKPVLVLLGLRSNGTLNCALE